MSPVMEEMINLIESIFNLPSAIYYLDEHFFRQLPSIAKQLLP